MAIELFKSLASHKIINQLYDDRKDFIILGLCGRVGSGVSTISRILEMSFDEMQLPPPRYDAEDPLGSREYRIIYTYARENWNTFYKIRTSALITRHILDNKVEDFCKYIEQISKCKDPIIREQAEAFFNAEMECEWEQYYRYHQRTQKEDIRAPWKLLECDCYVEELEKDAKTAEPWSGDTPKVCELQFDRDPADQKVVGQTAPAQEGAKEKKEETIKFIYYPKTGKCCFQNKELAKMLKKYAECRRKNLDSRTHSGLSY